MKWKSQLLAAACGVVMAAAAASASSATEWEISGAFADGGRLSGFVVSDVSNFLSSWKLITTAGASFAGAVYDSGSGNYDPRFDPYRVWFYSGPNAPPTLFAQVTSSGNNGALLNLAGYECTGFVCDATTAARGFTGLAVAVPGPEAGTGLLMVGLAAVGLLWRRRAA